MKTDILKAPFFVPLLLVMFARCFLSTPLLHNSIIINIFYFAITLKAFWFDCACPG
jgi:hypothetical protein